MRLQKIYGNQLPGVFEVKLDYIQIPTLSKLRDTLLSKLMSGEVSCWGTMHRALTVGHRALTVEHCAVRRDFI